MKNIFTGKPAIVPVHFILITFLLAGSCTSSKQPVDATIPFTQDHVIWQNKQQLTWKDFQGDNVVLNKDNSIAKAATYWGLGYYYNENHHWVLCAIFFKKRSWVLGGQAADRDLRHEQYHFNIAEVYARKIRKAAMEQKAAIRTGAYEKIRVAMFTDCRLAQIAYDKATMHSFDWKEQQHWERDIDSKLDELVAYSNEALGY